MNDYTLKMMLELFKLGRDLEKEVIIDSVYITIGDYRYNHGHNGYRFDESLLPAIAGAHAYFGKEIYGDSEYFKRKINET